MLDSMPPTDSDSLFRMPTGVETRWATAENPLGERSGACVGNDGRKRRPSVELHAGETHVLAEVEGESGCVRRIWITIDERDPAMLRGLRLQMFWDGATEPAVDVPLGDFFGHGLGRMTTFENAFFSSPEGRSFNCLVPMPFRTGMKLVVLNETDRKLAMLFYEVDYTVGDRHDDDVLYFHSFWNRQRPTALREDFQMLPAVTGRGRVLGFSVGVIADTGNYFKSWWGEGEVKVFLDGDTTHPTLSGTGTEDYIGTGWGQGHYTNLYQGCSLADHDRFEYVFYRLHVPDLIYFYREVKVTIQQIGCWDPTSSQLLHEKGSPLFLGEDAIDLKAAAEAKGYGLYERQDDWSSCAYFYLDRPTNGLPPLASLETRVAGLISREELA